MARRPVASQAVNQRELAVVEPLIPGPAPADSRNFFLCLLLFAASGCAALIYEVVWFQLLQLVIGASAVSLGLLLAAYMGGLCLGSYFFARFVERTISPLRVYAYLEIGIALFGIVGLFGVPLVGKLYLAVGFTGVVLRGLIAAVCLLPPTILMGASLPALSRYVGDGPDSLQMNAAAKLGWLYSANIAGAVVGCLFAGFYLLRVYDMGVATYTAAAINLAVAAVAYAVGGKSTPSASPVGAQPAASPGATLIYLAVGLSGLTALGAEVVWTRIISLMLGATVYAFSIILAVFLAGLWAGSSVGSLIAKRMADPKWGLAGCQVLLMLSIAWTAYYIAAVLPYWPVDPWLASSPWFLFDMDVTRALRAILPSALCWGASFPLALAALMPRDGGQDEDPARLTGVVYAVNTIGSIIGALAFSLILFPAIGSGGTERWLVALAALSAAAAIWVASKARGPALAGIVVVGAASVVIIGLIPGVPWQVIAYGRRVAPMLRGVDLAEGLRPAEPLFVGEGISSSAVITQRGDQRFFYVSGKSEASSAPIDMRLQRMMGHWPALFHANPKNVLVVGFGAGVTAGTFVTYPEVQSITICELEPMIPPASGTHFAKENHDVIHDPRTHIVYDDGRHYITSTRNKYDIITTDPIHPWVKGTSTLYSKEYYETVKAHLNPGGVVAQWLPIYDSDEETVRTELATFFNVFPHATVWSNFLNGDGYDLVLIGRDGDAPLDADKMEQRLRSPQNAKAAASLAGVSYPTAMDILASYAGRAEDLQPMVAGTPLNEDLNLRLQYLAGLGLNSTASPAIYKKILSYRKFPEGLITGTPEHLAALRALIEKPQRTF